MNGFLPTSWDLHCAWCDWLIEVNPRGGRGADQGSGVEAAELMQAHVEQRHTKTWHEYLVQSAALLVEKEKHGR